MINNTNNVFEQNADKNTKPCIACGMSIDKTAKTCPHCGTKQQKNTAKTYLVAIICGFFALTAVTAIENYQEMRAQKAKGNDNKIQTQQEELEDQTAEESEETGITTDDYNATVESSEWTSNPEFKDDTRLSTTAESPATAENVTDAAKSWLETSPYSEKGLIEMLEFVGYERDEAEAAVKSLDVNWFENAAKKAEIYVDGGIMSEYIELYDRLVYDGFTELQATFGAEAATATIESSERAE